jgi:putative metalloprotease
MGAVDSGVDAFYALALGDDDVKAEARAAAEEMDSLNEVAPEDNKYGKRLARLTEGLENYDGLKLNFKVYLVTDINAFAMPDGTVRVFSPLMDIMEDDELMAIIGHEIGHVKFKHSFAQMRAAMLTQSAKNLIGQSGGYPAALADSKLGQLAYSFINAQYSQSDELESDAFAVTFLRQQRMDPDAAVRAIQALQNEFGDSNHFLSSHPSNSKRIEALKQVIAKQG